MSPYTTHAIQKETADKRDCTYDLFAVVVHIGANIHKGHYVNYAKFNGEWFSFNDHIVEWVTEESVLRQKAYVLTSRTIDVDISVSILNTVWSMSMMRL